MSNPIINKSPSARKILKAAIYCFADAEVRQEKAHRLWVDKKISDEEFIERFKNYSVMTGQVNAIVDMFASMEPLPDEEVNKALSIAPDCLRFTPWNTKK